jgi:hypothetical protein
MNMAALKRSNSKIAVLAAAEAPSTIEQKQKLHPVAEAEPLTQGKLQDKINRSEYTFFRPIHVSKPKTEPPNLLCHFFMFSSNFRKVTRGAIDLVQRNTKVFEFQRIFSFRSYRLGT